ncbi:MAG: acyl-ACP--UDP-N-acetylglucosamine O-acyltransferase [Acidobacteria bacterium]|nr:acyl-ACP--UDP-N-acetylglucosamine O-acyltransferase [Acidobacteriota bacterium]MBU4405057.1 acyl-ACP--UDP-N-acetylglucosamine O-acyltransferase [Acidobacteriota bacterium]MCG2811693.1 acyl-ACP--UDP-N-acetylglucosamine O-acyltransferase [Candidatus Aminicenantes bacterium]
MNQPLIHPTAVINPKGELGRGVQVDAYAVIGPGVSIGDSTVIKHHATIDKNTTIGKNCLIFPFSSLGTDPQDITFKGEDTFVHIGDNNIIREFTTINRGTPKGGSHTRLGDDNYLMAYAHVGHDCQIGSHVILSNGATLAGHVEIDDYVVLSAFCAVHQFVHIGRNAYIGGYSIVCQDILPFAKVAQSRESFSLYGPNSIGMMRNGFNREFIENIKDIFHIVYRSDLNTTQAVKKIGEDHPGMNESQVIIDFISKSKRGILKNFRSDE